MRRSPVEELCGVEVEVDGRPLCPEEEELRWDGCIVRSVRSARAVRPGESKERGSCKLRLAWYSSVQRGR